MPNEHSKTVLLCHSSGDRTAVRDLYHRLKAEGVAAWLDEEDILPGRDWRTEIELAIRAHADAIIVFLSKESTAEPGYVSQEIEFALDVADQQADRTIFVIPAKLEKCDLPARLKPYPAVDLFKPTGYEKLLKALAAAGVLEARPQPATVRLDTGDWVVIPESKGYWIGAQSKDPNGRNYDPEAFDSEPLRQVDIPAFRIGRHPVTVAQFVQFVNQASGSRKPERWLEQLENRTWPVVSVTWHLAKAYCEWAGGRLPSEEEWERAARGPNGTKYPWGNQDVDPSRANYDESLLGHPTPAGQYPAGASPEGVHDLAGNVWEWTSSEYAKGSGSLVWRGGSFAYSRRYVRSSCRFTFPPGGHSPVLGLRVAAGIS